MNLLVKPFQRQPRCDDQATYVGGDTVRRVQRGTKIDWYLNGAPASEREVNEYMENRRAASRSNSWQRLLP